MGLISEASAGLGKGEEGLAVRMMDELGVTSTLAGLEFDLDEEKLDRAVVLDPVEESLPQG
jgi:hypothetical protein